MLTWFPPQRSWHAAQPLIAAALSPATVISMKNPAAWLLLVLAAASVEASDPLQEAVAARDWRSGLAACERLAATEARRPDRRQLSAPAYAQKAAHCAAIASGAGDQELATWWWFTAVAMDAKAALGLLPRFRASELLLHLPPPRTLAGATRLERGEVQLPTGDIVAGESIAVSVRPDPPRHLFRPVTAVASTEVTVEFLVDTAGRPTQPLLVSAEALPLHAFLAFDYLRTWRFKPASINGEPVTSVFRLTISTSSSGRGAA